MGVGLYRSGLSHGPRSSAVLWRLSSSQEFAQHDDDDFHRCGHRWCVVDLVRVFDFIW